MHIHIEDFGNGKVYGINKEVEEIEPFIMEAAESLSVDNEFDYDSDDSSNCGGRRSPKIRF